MNDANDSKSQPDKFRLGYLMNRAHAGFNETLGRELAVLDITAAQYLVFAQIAAHAHESAAGLCKDHPYDPGAMARMLERLEKKNLLRRVRSTEDRRVVQLEISAQGRSLQPVLDACSDHAASRFFRGFSGAELAQFENFLARLVANR